MNENFFIISNEITKLKIPKSAMILFGKIQSNAKRLGYAYGTNKYYAKELNCSTRSITNLLKILKNNNLIRIENPKSFRRKIYIRK